MESELVELITCAKCGQQKPADARDKHLCTDCVKAENNRYSYLRMHQGDWMAEAKDAGIDPWLQQPGETQWEYTVWVAYRDSYPGKKPTISDVAKQLTTTYNVVKKIAQRWSFPMRMQAWMAECDRLTLAQRRQEILDMNATHISMAQKLRQKLDLAIDCIDPASLKASDLNSLMKTMAELERKARVDEIAVDELRTDLLKDVDNPNLKKTQVQQNDLKEVVDILLNAGALGSITQIGVKTTETKTTEVVAIDSDGNEARHISGGDDNG